MKPANELSNQVFATVLAELASTDALDIEKVDLQGLRNAIRVTVDDWAAEQRQSAVPKEKP